MLVKFYLYWDAFFVVKYYLLRGCFQFMWNLCVVSSIFNLINYITDFLLQRPCFRKLDQFVNTDFKRSDHYREQICNLRDVNAYVRRYINTFLRYTKLAVSICKLNSLPLAICNLFSYTERGFANISKKSSLKQCVTDSLVTEQGAVKWSGWWWFRARQSAFAVDGRPTSAVAENLLRKKLRSFFGRSRSCICINHVPVYSGQCPRLRVLAIFLLRDDVSCLGHFFTPGDFFCNTRSISLQLAS